MLCVGCCHGDSGLAPKQLLRSVGGGPGGPLTQFIPHSLQLWGRGEHSQGKGYGSVEIQGLRGQENYIFGSLMVLWPCREVRKRRNRVCVQGIPEFGIRKQDPWFKEAEPMAWAGKGAQTLKDVPCFTTEGLGKECKEN